IAASLGCLVDLGEVTSLDVGLVALHQAQRYAVLCNQRRGTLMTNDISHVVRSSFGSRHDSRGGFQGRDAKASARKRVDRRQQPQPAHRQ
ncbi:hypothetical protein, partial [Aeromonas dhakensis]|uniref:hypothetical protein n=1 Tax=Aeromonas dhakensis TaxID=196024 RepID=UPI001BDE9124